MPFWERHAGESLLDTPEMAEFFERLDRLDELQLLSMRAVWHSTSREAHEEAWAAVRAVGAREGLTKEIGRVRDKAAGWATRGNNSVPYMGRNDNSWTAAKLEAEEAIVDAALAVALGSRLEAGPRRTLIGPWLRATEAAG